MELSCLGDIMHHVYCYKGMMGKLVEILENYIVALNEQFSINKYSGLYYCSILAVAAWVKLGVSVKNKF